MCGVDGDNPRPAFDVELFKKVGGSFAGFFKLVELWLGDGFKRWDGFH